MRIHIEETPLRDCWVVNHDIFEDELGFFMEVFRHDEFKNVGLPERFMQLNHSRSTRNVLRGLHFQWEAPMGKLMRVTRGTAFLVAVDIRHDSPTLGQWFGTEVSEHNKKQLWAPAGFARGFCVLSDVAEVQYLCTASYNPSGEGGIRFDDADIGLAWPVENPMTSEKDRTAQSFKEWLAKPESRTFHY